MNEPKQYEVLDASTRQHVCLLRPDNEGPFNFLKGTQHSANLYVFKQLPDGPLSRVEAGRSIKRSEVREGDEAESINVADKWLKVQASDVALIHEREVHHQNFRRPAHLVLIPAEPEAQLSSQTTKGGDEICRDTNAPLAESANAETQSASTRISEAALESEPSDAAKEGLRIRLNQGKATESGRAQFLRVEAGSQQAVPPEPQRETEWRDIQREDVRAGDYVKSLCEDGSWFRVEKDDLKNIHESITAHCKFRRPIAPAQREGMGLTPEEKPLSYACFALMSSSDQHECYLRTFQRLIVSEASLTVAYRCLREEDAALLQREADVRALQTERDALKAQLTKIGNTCIVSITGAAEDGNETDPEILWKAISESVCLRHERNDEANALRGQLAGMTKDRDEWEALCEQNTKLACERGEHCMKLNTENAKLTASLTAAKAELATRRDRAHSLFRQISMLAPNLEAARNLAHDGIKEMVSPTPPPSAQV